MLTLSIIFAWFTSICYGFVLISSAASANQANLFEQGEKHHFTYEVNVLLNEIADANAKNVGYSIKANVAIETIWQNSLERALKIELLKPRLSIRSRAAPTPDGFIEHTSNLDTYRNDAIYVHWKNGEITNVYSAKMEQPSLLNLKKGLASLLQFQLVDLERSERDSSGVCNVKYNSLAPNRIEKVKSDCKSDDLAYFSDDNPFLGLQIESVRRIVYEFGAKLDRIETIVGEERHFMHLKSRQSFGNSIITQTRLKFVKLSGNSEVTLTANTFEDVIRQVRGGGEYVKNELLTELERVSEKVDFLTVLNEVRSGLKQENVGTVAGAKAFMALLKAARAAKVEIIGKALGSKKNEKILTQIYDVLGFVQTEELHEFILKKLHFDREEHCDLSERYLWALSFASHPNAEIIKNLLHRYTKSQNIPDKVKETLLLTIASMTSHLQPRNAQILNKVTEVVLAGLDYAKNEERHQFLRALKTLQNNKATPVLFEVVQKGSRREAVLAMNALKALQVDELIEKVAFRTLYQLDRLHDSSARTVAVDILLDSGTNKYLPELVEFLARNESSYEVKQYLFQRMRMLSDDNWEFRGKCEEMVHEKGLNNYLALAPRGVSTAFKREFMRHDNLNGSLITTQEVNGGIMKRGLVNVILEKNGKNLELFSLGMFAGGLGGFVSSNSNEADEEESATAGLDITVLSRQIRPFVFFTGQGELMGHVWSGTGSEKTSAIQATTLLQDHSEYIRLGAGFLAELVLQGAVSFDLSGKIEISIWSRTADALVEKQAGLVINGLIRVDSDFVRSQSEFVTTIEPKLSIKSDIDFSDKVKLCMQVTQPDSILRHNTFKVERIPGSKHKLRIAKYRKNTVPGTSYALNRKNNNMCRLMFS